MLAQLIPLLILSAIFGLYTLKCIVVYLWEESMRIAATYHKCGCPQCERIERMNNKDESDNDC